MSTIPTDYEVQPDPNGNTTCGTCGRSWDDDKVTGVTPAPSGRCPFEYWHEPDEARHPMRNADPDTYAVTYVGCPPGGHPFPSRHYKRATTAERWAGPGGMVIEYRDPGDGFGGRPVRHYTVTP